MKIWFKSRFSRKKLGDSSDMFARSNGGPWLEGVPKPSHRFPTLPAHFLPGFRTETAEGSTWDERSVARRNPCRTGWWYILIPVKYENQLGWWHYQFFLPWHSQLDGKIKVMFQWPPTDQHWEPEPVLESNPMLHFQLELRLQSERLLNPAVNKYWNSRSTHNNMHIYK